MWKEKEKQIQQEGFYNIWHLLSEIFSIRAAKFLKKSTSYIWKDLQFLN